MTDFRALCAKLLSEIDAGRAPVHDRVTLKLRAALDEPEGEGAPVAWLYDGDPWFDGNTWVKEWAVTTDKRLAQFKAEPSEPIPLYRYSRPAPAPKPIPVSERLPNDGDCLVTSLGLRYCWWASEAYLSGQVRLIWKWKSTIEQHDFDWCFVYWLPASTQFLPTTVDSDQPT